jgi:predicted peptidase
MRKLKLQVTRTTFLALAFLGVSKLAAQDGAYPFVPRVLNSAGRAMPYRLFIPTAAVRAHPLPLVIYLHGSGGAGDDNAKQIVGGNRKGSHLWIRPDIQEHNPAFVVAPQAPTTEQWGSPDSTFLTVYGQLVLDLIGSLSREFNIDPNRLYIVGQSRGGRGVWDLVTKSPSIFAAAVPVCGDGSPARIVAAKGVAIWAFHGAKDNAVPVAGSRKLVAALKAAGGSIRYTEYPDVGHDAWNYAFIDPELPPWLFAQKRAKT